MTIDVTQAPIAFTPGGAGAAITLAADAWIVVIFTVDAAAASLAVSSNISGGFGASKNTENDVGNQQDTYAFAKWCAAGAHTITVSGTGIGFDYGTVTEVVGGGSGTYDQAVGQVQTTTTPSSGNTGTLAAQPALGLAVCLNTSFSGVTPVADTGSGFTDEGSFANGGGLNGRTEQKRVTATTAFAGTFTGTSSAFTTVMVVIGEADGAPPPAEAPPVAPIVAAVMSRS